MAITNLSGTKWQINSLTCSAGYGNFDVGDIKKNDTPYENSFLYVGYKWNTEELVATANTITIMQYLETLAVGDTIEFLGESESGLVSTNLISWLEQNATLLYQPPEPVLQITPFLTNIANAIRTKKGTTEPINAQNFASEIESIETGGSSNWTEEPNYSGTINLDGIYTNGILYTFKRYNEHVVDCSKSNISSGSTGSITINSANMIFIDFNNAVTVLDMCKNLNNVEVLYDGGYSRGSFAIVKPTGDNWSFTLEVMD